ncbi:MAG: SMC-Scp complex subunit ScpB [Deltaproteobacteria bacterium]|nr:SMC-Scp complex subunit ScpB [Deltaproteobacteria bacterium]
MSEDDLKLIVESLVFASDVPVTPEDIQKTLGHANRAEIMQALAELAADFDRLDRSFHLREVAGGYQFRTRPGFKGYISKMKAAAPVRMSRAALEALAVIAYKQPVLRIEVDQVRGVESGGIIRTLMERGLVKIVGRKDLPGRPMIYGTTRRFLEVFELSDLKDLPSLKEIEAMSSATDDRQITLPLTLDKKTEGQRQMDNLLARLEENAPELYQIQSADRETTGEDPHKDQSGKAETGSIVSHPRQESTISADIPNPGRGGEI